MGAILTRLAIGGLILSVLLLFTTLFMVDLGNDYGVGNNFHLQQLQSVDYDDKGNAIRDLAFNSTDSLLADGVDNQATDEAQLSGAYDANNQQLENGDIIASLFTVVTDVLPVHADLFNMLLTGLLAILVSAAGLYVVFKVIP